MKLLKNRPSPILILLVSTLGFAFCHPLRSDQNYPSVEHETVAETDAPQDYFVNVNRDDKGQHEVHVESCRYLPKEKNRKYLGRFSRCEDALYKANQQYAKSDGCHWCARHCDH